ncbi:MAG TPA: glycoside hydrolase family 32 protein [Mucilaginibacter sp.]
MNKAKYLVIGLLISTAAMAQKPAYKEQYRPQIHFSPPAHWMNDPNGLLFYKGTYHLFYQYYPKASVWGPMHWGHATSADMIHWKNQPVALYPDSLGYIFSGSAVVDYNNTSGLGKNGQPPLVAIFTHHDQAKEKDGKNDTENESIAYSNDDGKTWHKYDHNPVLKNPGISDFRDPNVIWYAPEKKWVMSLATKDRITFYSSPNLKEWKKESEFGEHLGAHGGVWECPALFPITASDGKKLWVLIVNINPGGPNGGSATQYFVGNFDGSKFKQLNNDTRWIDIGTDEYAGVTFHNTGSRNIFLGWMSNWEYATSVPTGVWRSANTVPRELKLVNLDHNYYVTSEPVKELNTLKTTSIDLKSLDVKGDKSLTKLIKRSDNQYELKFSSKQLKSFSLILSNKGGEQLVIGLDAAENNWYIDRTKAGISDFNKNFAKRIVSKRIANEPGTDVTLVVDVASVELFADKGSTVMTAIFFPKKPYTNIDVNSKDGFEISDLTYSPLKSIWP